MVNLVYYKIQDGVKVKCLRSIDKSEFLALRNSPRQKALVKGVREGKTTLKMMLLQMNYSCLPNEDGTLKGATRVSNSVGMDIDHVPQSHMQMLQDVILSKKDELGLLMLEKSARGSGYHIAFRRRTDLTQEENLKWASTVLGVDYDKGAKDITRVFFSTTASPEDLIYLDDEIFQIKSVECKVESLETVEKVESGKSTLNSELTTDSKLYTLNSQLLYHGIPYSRIIEAWLGGEKVQPGDRHRTSLYLADHLRYITDNDAGLIEHLLRQTPFVQEIVQERNENVAATVKSAQGYTFYKNIPARMKDALARAQESVHSSEGAEGLLDRLVEGWNPPSLPSKLPRLIQLLIKPFPEQYHPMLIVTACVILGAISSHFRSTYIDGRVIAPNLYAAIIAESGKGKNWVTMLFELMCRHTLQTWDDQEWKKVRENQEMRDRKSNAKDKPPKYHPKLRIMETMSKTSLLEVQTNLGENGMILCNYTESDELANASRVQFSNLSVLLRKAWDLDTHRQFYMSEASCNTQTRLNAAILLTGTPRSVLTRLFSDTESGMMQRFIPMMMPNLKRTFRPPRFMPLSPDEEAERDALLVTLWQKDLSLGEGTLDLEMPKTQKMVYEWYDALEERYSDGELTESEADLSRRVGQFMQRAAIPFVALYEEEQKEVLDLVQWLGNFAYYNICHIFASRVAEDMKESRKILHARTDARITAEPLLNLMPEVFTIQQFREERLRQGQSPDVTMLLSRYSKKGKVQRLEKGVYRKLMKTE